MLLPGGVVRVFQHVLGGEQLAGGDARLFHRLEHLLGGPLSSPLGDHGVKLLLVLAAGVVGGEPLALGPLGVPDGLGEPSKDGVGVGPYHDVVVVPGGVGVRRRHEGQDGPGAAPDVPGERVLGDRALHEREHGLVDADVHDLAPAAVRLAVVEGRHRAQGPEGRGERVAEADPDPRRRPVGEARSRA